MRETPCRGAAPERANLYVEVTEKVVAELEAGRFPWVQPWGVAGAAGHPGTDANPGGIAAGLPRNALTHRPYSGINILILWGAVIEHGWPAQGWLTFAQALAAGGAVRKGERGTTVVYADRFVPKEKGDGETSRRRSDVSPSGHAREAGDNPRSIPFLKRFTLFNTAQCEGLPDRLCAANDPLPECETIPAAERLIAATGADFRIGGSRACYVPTLDFVAVPPQPAFHEQINYYRTCFHELTHWTGHRSRLARDLSGRFGSKSYAREELVAELGAAFLCASLGIVPTVRHADYLASWLDVLRDDLSEDASVRGTGAPRGRAIFRAASQASKAADFLLSFTGDAPADELSPPLGDE